jgi:glycosyltransferase involved in cell wall biosynthesis
VRILQVTPFFYPHAGGVESHVRALAREMTRLGHEVTVLTSRHDASLPDEEWVDGARVVRTRSWGVVFNTPVGPQVRRRASELTSDVAHLHYPPPLTSYFAARGLNGSRRPVCLTYHCDLYLPGLPGRLLTSLYERIFLPPTLSAVDRIVVHTRSYARTSRSLRGRAVEIIPSSVDLVRFRPDIDGSDVRRRLGLEGFRVLVFTGRLVPHKGVDAILRTLPELPRDVALLVVGRGPQFPVLRQLARRLGVESRVRFCSNVGDDELPSYLRVADLFVFPSQNRLEGFGLVVAEALASGLPVVIADIPGVREVIEPGREGVLVEPMLAGDLTARIRELLEDPERRRAMGEAARRRAEERYGLTAISRALLDLYARLLDSG